MIDQLIQNISPETISNYFRKKVPAFKPLPENLNHILREQDFVEFSHLQKIGEVEYDNADELLVLSCQYKGELTSRSSKRKQYDIAKKVLKEEFKDAAIFAFIDETGKFRFSLIRTVYSGGRRDWTAWKRYTYFVDPEKPNKTFRNQINKCAFDTLDHILKAFSIDAVTDEFYNAFSPKFDEIANSVQGNAVFGIKQDFSLLFVIRTIFIGFVQKRKWLGNDDEFMQSFWQEYKDQYYGQNLFYSRWLDPLFFEALNSKPGTEVQYRNNDFSKETRIALKMAPYLNGELFKRKTGFDDLDLIIPDKTIGDFFEFLFQYNFTIEENTRYDEDLELNPEFLGIIFERLVNKKDGAVYTPRTEVDFMCRIALVKWLQKVSSANTRDLYYLFFREMGQGAEFEDYQKDGDFSRNELEELITLLKNVTTCDPASGSGAFPVGMMQVLNEVLCNLQSREKTPEQFKNEDDFERKKAIIAHSLYGVEVKRWAVWINQLRLWLSLFVDIPSEKETEFRNSFTPLLPNLGFKIRRGDSIVQRIGNKIFPVHGHERSLSSTLKKQITELKKAKIDFFYNRSGAYNEISKKENSIFRTIINEQISEKIKELRSLKREPEAEQTSMFGNSKPKQTNLELYKAQIEQLENEIQVLNEEKEAFRDDHPLIWNIEFAEIFYEKGGFDIQIGNPPYVRQEDIADPESKIIKATDYKKLLQETIRQEYPKYFKAKEKIDGKSDLYTFFYLKSMRLLNENGVHTFICSNSWLDVGYGVWMQKFLLSHCRVHFIIDNHARRSFANADVNTIISVMDAPVTDRRKLNTQFEYKFVAFKQPFEEVLFTENLLEIEGQKNEIIKKAAFRSYPVSIEKLLEESSDFENEQQRKLKDGKYIGDKWGGKYLRAPDIFFTILEKGKKLFSRIIDHSVVKYGIKSGYNNFFYLKDELIQQFRIEKKYLKPIIKSPSELKSYQVEPSLLRNKVFLCNEPKSELKATNALKYIEYGENLPIKIRQGKDEGTIIKGVQNIDSIKNRKFWYSLGEVTGNCFWVKETNERLVVFISETNIIADCRLYYGNFPLSLRNFFNSSIYNLFCEVLTRSGLGLGARSQMVNEVNQHMVLDINFLNQRLFLQRKVKDIFTECGIDPTSGIPISEQEPQPLPDRKELDEVVFDVLGLNSEERKEVYRAVCQLVWNRISKAKNV
ncbi:MAG: Eco57I restriction-modification methylase domain-containing protein [Mariniphaga sp.]|nr:Eco57I restriction-modification methylase domain-containing protein [Mariniphaga sp.]